MEHNSMRTDAGGFPVYTRIPRARARTYTVETGDASASARKTPRPYQNEMIADTRAVMVRHRRVLLQQATGAGKTFIATTIAKVAAAKGKRVVFLVHRIELLDQTSRTFAEEGIEHGVIRAGEPTPDVPVLVAMIQTLARRLGKVPTPDLVFADEAQHAVSGTWMNVLNAWSDAYLIGLSATPQRLDGRGLGDVFETMVQGPTTAELIRDGYLSPYRAYAPTTLDLSGVRTSMGDFATADVSAAVDKPSITGDIIEHYQSLAAGKRAILFAATRAHSRHLAEVFTAAGIPAEHVDGETPADVRERAVADFAAGRLRVLTNVELFGEGFDVPGAEVVILARPTQSLSLYLQQVGRVLRPAPGKYFALILDHVGNIARHGLPDDPREWALTSERRQRQSNDNGPAVRQCPSCFCCHRPAAVCPECGWKYAPVVRELEQRAGKLVQIERPEDWAPGIDIANARGHQWFRLLESAGSNENRLRQIAKARGFRRGWVQHRMREVAAA
ncbi:MAG: DEAD/DEAH box helicase [Rhodospirillaceae bacterium]